MGGTARSGRPAAGAGRRLAAWVGAAVSVEHEGLTGDILEHWPNMNEAAVAAWFMCICIVRSFQAWIPRILAHTPEKSAGMPGINLRKLS